MLLSWNARAFSSKHFIYLSLGIAATTASSASTQIFYYRPAVPLRPRNIHRRRSSIFVIHTAFVVESISIVGRLYEKYACWIIAEKHYQR